LFNAILALLVASSVLTASIASAASGFSGPYEMQNWTASGPGTTSITPTSGAATSAVFHYEFRPASSGTWTFGSVAAADSTVRFNWTYSGYHAFFLARAGLNAFADGPLGRTTVTLRSSQPSSGGFSDSGTACLQVNTGMAFGLVASGSHNDSDRQLIGDITLTNLEVVDGQDCTPPVITPSVEGTPGSNGYYTSDVDVTWTVTDPDSDIASSDGCDATTVTTDTTGTTLTCTATSVGGTSTQSVTIKRDATAPTITVPANITAYATSPNDEVVNFDAPTVADNLSGATASCAPVSGTAFPVGTTTVVCTATDGAENSATGAFTVTVVGADQTLEELYTMVENTSINGTSSTAASVRRTMLMMVVIAESLEDNGQTTLTCLQLTRFDLEVRSQVAKRRIDGADASLLYAKTTQIRAMIGCGDNPSFFQAR